MSNLSKVQENINKKLTLQDYKTEIQQEEKVAIQRKMTIYLTEESFKKLNEICSKNVLESGKPDKSTLINKAIELLYESTRI